MLEIVFIAKYCHAKSSIRNIAVTRCNYMFMSI